MSEYGKMIIYAKINPAVQVFVLQETKQVPSF